VSAEEALRAERDAWRERALAAERWRDEAWRPLQERAASGREAEWLAARLEHIEGSWSWRITAPLRAAGRLAYRVRRRLRNEWRKAR
jgi:hypothetical protein